MGHFPNGLLEGQQFPGLCRFNSPQMICQQYQSWEACRRRTCPLQLIATFRKVLPVERRHLSALAEEHLAQLAFAQHFTDLLKCKIRQ
jgi:hypothetical protein